MKYSTSEAQISAEDTPSVEMSDYLEEAFSYDTALVVPTAVHSRTLYRPLTEPYGLDEATGPAYREEPPETISYGGPAPPMESRKVRAVVDTSPQIQDPINHVIKVGGAALVAKWWRC